MNITRKLFGVAVTLQSGQHSNVVTRVRWGLEFERGGFTSLAFIETFLNIADLSNFTPVEQLTKEQIIQWAFDTQNGDQIIAEQWAHHESMISYAALQASVVEYQGIPLDSAPAAPRAPSEVTIPEVIL